MAFGILQDGQVVVATGGDDAAAGDVVSSLLAEVEVASLPL